MFARSSWIVTFCEHFVERLFCKSGLSFWTSVFSLFGSSLVENVCFETMDCHFSKFAYGTSLARICAGSSHKCATFVSLWKFTRETKFARWMQVQSLIAIPLNLAFVLCKFTFWNFTCVKPMPACLCSSTVTLYLRKPAQVGKPMFKFQALNLCKLAFMRAQIPMSPTGGLCEHHSVCSTISRTRKKRSWPMLFTCQIPTFTVCFSCQISTFTSDFRLQNLLHTATVNNFPRELHFCR